MHKIKVSEVSPVQLAEGVTAHIINSDKMTIMYANLKEGSTVPEHKHLHEQVVNVIEGDFELVVEGKPHRMAAGEMFLLPSNIPHSAHAITECKIIDIFHPVRDDLKPGFAGYTNQE